MDDHTLQLLELHQVRQLLASFAGSSLGKELAGQTSPRVDLAWIRSAQRETTEMRQLLDAGVGPPLGGLHDVRPLARRAATGSMLVPEELLQVAQTLRCAERMAGFLDGLDESATALRARLGQLADLLDLRLAIDNCIDETGQVRAGASPLLRSLRRQIANGRNSLRGQIQQLMTSQAVKAYLQYNQHSVAGERLVLAVQTVHKSRVPGIIHRTSDSGATVYIEPAALVGLGNDMTEKAEAERDEIKRILRELSGAVGARADDILRTLDALADLDFIHARGAFSRSLSMVEPEMTPGRALRLRAARHPLLEWHIRHRHPDDPPGPDSVVPIDVRLGEAFDLLVVTGPNTGGKTIALKTVGLLCLMAQCGLHVPARQAVLPAFDKVFADIGDEQSIQQSLSTFSSHMSRIVQVLAEADVRSLVLLDELGAGTDPAEGAALGRAILEELRQRGCLCIVTTHLGALKLYPYRTPRAQNACVEFDIDTLGPTYRLLIGEAGQSNALVIARRLGLPEEVVKRAKGYVQRPARKLEEVIGEVQESRREAEQLIEQAQRARRQAHEAREHYERIQREIEEKARRYLPPEAMLPFEVGDEVYVQRFNRVGRVVRVNAHERLATVAVGQVEAQLDIDELRPASEAPKDDKKRGY